MNRRERWTLGIALLLALGVMIWFVQAANERAVAEPAVRVRANAMIPSELPIEPLSAASPEPGATAPAHGPDEIELCGGVWVKTKPDGEFDQDELNRAIRLPEARARLVDDLRAAPDELARAAGLWVSTVGRPETQAMMQQTLAGCVTPECTAAPRDAEFVVARDALVRMALSTNDPQVYAIAFNNCGRGASADGTCPLLSAEQWARLDPTNAAPWLFVLEQASRRRDAAGEAEALHRIATSAGSAPNLYVVPGVIVDHLPASEASKAASLTLVAESIATVVAWSVPNYQTLLTACSKETLRDSNRSQNCNAVAELLIERPSTLMERQIGLALGQRLDWSAERIDRLRGEYTAYLASKPFGQSENSPGGCPGINEGLEEMKRLIRVGEIGGLREWVKQSGKTADDFIRIERASRAARAAEAASASAASSAASATR